MIDVHDCDVRLPSSGDARDLYMDELVRLSVIGGRVVKTIYRCVFLVPSHTSMFRSISAQPFVYPSLLSGSEYICIRSSFPFRFRPSVFVPVFFSSLFFGSPTLTA